MAPRPDGTDYKKALINWRRQSDKSEQQKPKKSKSKQEKSNG
jgi:hypothetical protein